MIEQLSTPAADALRSLLKSLVKGKDDREPDEISVYAFERQGLRLSEVGYVFRTATSTSGGAWMRSDVDAHAAILACEDFLLFHDDPIEVHEGSVGDKYDPTIYDPAQEAAQAVAHAVTGEMPKWEDRWPSDLKVPDGTVWYDDEKRAAYERAQKETPTT